MDLKEASKVFLFFIFFNLVISVSHTLYTEATTLEETTFQERFNIEGDPNYEKIAKDGNDATNEEMKDTSTGDKLGSFFDKTFGSTLSWTSVIGDVLWNGLTGNIALLSSSQTTTDIWIESFLFGILKLFIFITNILLLVSMFLLIKKG